MNKLRMVVRNVYITYVLLDTVWATIRLAKKFERESLDDHGNKD